MQSKPDSPSAISARARRRLPLLVAFVASIALHAALFGLAPSSNRGDAPAVRLAALEVVLRPRAEPLPVAVPRSNAQSARSAPVSQPQPARDRAVEPVLVARSSPGLDSVIAPAGSSDAKVAPERPLAGETAVSAAPAARTKAAALPDARPGAASSSAAYLESPAPRYPDDARRLGQEGTVMLRVLVAVNGNPARVDLERSSGSPYLDGAALERVRNWRFRPALQGSAPVESWVIVPIIFRLE